MEKRLKFVIVLLHGIFSLIGQESPKNLQNLVFGADNMQIQYLYPATPEYSVGIDNANDRFQLLLLRNRDYQKTYIPINDYVGIPSGRIRIVDIWNLNDTAIYIATSMDDLVVTFKEEVKIELSETIPASLPEFYTLSNFSVGFEEVKEKHLKRHKNTYFYVDGKKVDFDMENINESQKFFYSLNDWNHYWDRERLLLPFINIISDTSFLINYPKSHHFLIRSGGYSKMIDIPDQIIQNANSSYVFPVINTRMLAVVCADADTYSVFFTDPYTEKYMFWKTLEYRPYAFSDVGAYYRISHTVNDKEILYQYVTRYDRTAPVILQKGVEVSN